MRSAFHNLVPNLPVSPLALPPPSLRIEGVVTLDDCTQIVTEKRLPFCSMYDTERSRDAGSTVTTRLRGPKNGVHLIRPPCEPLAEPTLHLPHRTRSVP
jgi:hypothetical protein